MNTATMAWFLVRAAGLYAACAYLSLLFLRWYRPSLAEDWTPYLLALPLTAGLGYLLGSRQYFQEARLLLGSIGQTVFKDGQRVVAMGTVEALGPLLTSPFSRKECVAYQYEIDHEGRSPDGGRTQLRDFWGMAVTPYQIWTPAGPVRILGYAKLEAFIVDLGDEQGYQAAETYVRATSFRHPPSSGERYGSLAEPFDTESDSFSDDICANRKHQADEREDAAGLRALQLAERRLDVGENVCAAGQYSAAKKALVPTTRGTKQLRISTRSPELWAEENREWGHTYIRWGVGFTVFSVLCALATRWC